MTQEENTKGPYDDIIDLPRPISTKHPRMTMSQRAAQFAPFAALTGHNAAIMETARLTDTQLQLEESDLKELNERLTLLLSRIEEQPEVTLTHFIPDALKNGGRYIQTKGRLTKWNELEQEMIIDGKTTVPLSSIVAIDLQIE